MQRYTDEDNQTNDVVVQERCEATSGLPVASQPQVISHESRSDRNSGVEPKAQCREHADQKQTEQHQYLQPGNDEQIDVAE